MQVVIHFFVIVICHLGFYREECFPCIELLEQCVSYVKFPAPQTTNIRLGENV